MFKKIGGFVKRHKKFFGVLVVLLAAGLWYLRSTQQSAQVSFQTAKVERGKIVSTVTASGQVVVANRMAVTTTAGGLVKEVFVNNGDSVKTGDKILEVEPDAASNAKQADSWNSYLTAKNAVDSAQATALVLQSDMFTKWQAFLNLATNSTYQNSDQSPNYSNRAASQFHIAEADWLAAQAKFKNQQAIISQTQAGLNSTWLAYQNLSPTVTAPTGGTVSDLI
ncbi:efflux RND transporter periplasmic adaptor subunit, partial [Candidatus Gottesmanbacteria bacterium]|nr:efflux RND transporter periplasmic adaptor subunit [Candidatus Gottesmanbacteria bacterium]